MMSTDEKMDIAVGLILRTGVIAAATLVALGGAVYLAKRTGAPLAPDLRSIAGIFRGATALEPLYIIQLGLLVLMATPVIRVVACVIGFGVERDRPYVVISLIVLALLLVSLV